MTESARSSKRSVDVLNEALPAAEEELTVLDGAKHAKLTQPSTWRVDGRIRPALGEPDAVKNLPANVTNASALQNSTTNKEECLGLNPPKNLAMFLTKVHGVDESFAHNSSEVALGVKDILRYRRNGPLVKSAQFNYTINIDWTVQQYSPDDRAKPLTVVLGLPQNIQERQEKRAQAAQYKNVQLTFITLPMSYGTHHTKMMLLKYERGMRVVIHTSNMIEYDWYQKTQGVWISPFFPLLSDDEVAANNIRLTDYKDSVTQFKRDLVAYLANYKDALVAEWITEIRRHDMSKAFAFLVGSVPGRFTGTDKSRWGHLRLAALLDKHASPELRKATNSSAIIGQFSSIGSLGKQATSWVCSEFFSSLCRPTPTLPVSTLSLVFPTVENVRTSLEGYEGGGCLPYTNAKHQEQLWLQRLLHKWKSETNNRTRVIPHVKSYVRLTEDMSHAYWYLVTSANLSKAAWGSFEKNGSQLMIRSYELGVLLMPSILNQSSFRICNSLFNLRGLLPPSTVADESGDISTSSQSAGNDLYDLRIPFDVPVEPYDAGDKPWCGDLRYTLLDSHGEQYH